MMLNKDEELGCFEILKNNFPVLDGKNLVIGLHEFLSGVPLVDYISAEASAKERAIPYIQSKVPYIVLDESEGYRCLFFRGNSFRAHYDVTHAKMIRYVEESTDAPISEP